jgi:hypothetical protein
VGTAAKRDASANDTVHTQTQNIQTHTHRHEHTHTHAPLERCRHPTWTPSEDFDESGAKLSSIRTSVRQCWDYPGPLECFRVGYPVLQRYVRSFYFTKSWVMVHTRTYTYTHTHTCYTLTHTPAAYTYSQTHTHTHTPHTCIHKLTDQAGAGPPDPLKPWITERYLQPCDNR